MPARTTRKSESNWQGVLDSTAIGLQFLIRVGDASNVPALKGFALISSTLLDFCQSATANKDDCRSLAEDVCELAMAVVGHLELQENREMAPDPAFTRNMEDLCSKLERVHRSLAQLSRRSALAWFLRHAEDQVVLRRCRIDVKHALDVFSLNAHMQVEQALERAGVRERARHEEVVGVIRAVLRDGLAAITGGAQGADGVTETGGLWADLGSRMVLPPCPAIFYGRDAEVERLVEIVTDVQAPGRAALLGTMGVGKSSLVVKALYDPRVVEAFGERRFFVGCDGATGKDGLLTCIAGRLDLHGGNLQSQLLAFLGAGRTMLVLDNFEDPWEPLETRVAVEELLGLLADVEGLAIVVTMRGSERPVGVAWTRPTIAPLRPPALGAAKQIFVAICDCAEDDPHVDELLKAVDCLPLAVTLMATLAQSDTPETLLHRWRAERSSMLHRTHDRRTSLDVSIELSLNSPRMTAVPQAHTLLGLLAWLPDGVEDGKLEVLFPGMDARRAMSTLRQTALAQYDGHARTTVLAPIRAYMLGHHRGEEGEEQAMVAYYMEFATLAREVGGPHGQAVVRRLAEEIANTHSVVCIPLRGEGVEEQMARDAVKAAIDLSRFTRYTRLGDGTPLRLAVAVAERLGDTVMRADVFFNLAWLFIGEKEAEGWCKRAQALYEEIGNLGGQAECIWLLGQFRKNTYRQKESRVLFERALVLAKESGIRFCQAKCLSTLSEMSLYRGETDVSETQCREALEIFREEQSLTNIGLCLFWLGRIAELRSAYVSAATYFTEAIEILGVAGAKVECGRVLISLGDISLARCDYSKANSEYERALDIFRQHGYMKRSITAYTQLSLGVVAAELYDTPTATKWLDAAWQIFESKNVVHGLLHCQIVLGDLAFHSEDYAEAERLYQDALRKSRSAGFTDEEAKCVAKIGVLAHRRGQMQRAIRQEILAFAVYRKMANITGQAMAMTRLADVFLAQGESDIAFVLFGVSCPMHRRLGTLRGVADCLQGMGRILAGKDPATSEDYLNEARKLYESTRDGKKAV